MRRTKVCWLLTVVGMLFVCGSARAERIDWAPSWSAATRSAKVSGRLIMIDFYTDWCTYCKKMDAEVYTDPRVIREMKNVVAVKLDAERGGRELAKRYGVTGFPTMIFVSADGKEMTRIPGFVPAESFAKAIPSILRDARETPALEARLKKSPQDATIAGALAAAYTRRGDLASAVRVANIAAKSPPPGFAQTCHQIGGLYVRAQRLGDALSWFQRARTVSATAADRAVSLLLIGIVHQMRGDLKQATPAWRAAVETPGAPSDVVAEAKRRLAGGS